jgi:hypothetical protein
LIVTIPTDSATFDLRNGVLQTDKSVYRIGSDIILTLIEPDFDLDNEAAETYELDVTIRYTDGPASSTCPNSSVYDALIDASVGDSDAGRFDVGEAYSGEDFCILQGDILQVEYTDPADASGDENTVTDSATFDLRNGVLQSDKSVYIIGSDMILTLIEPDFDLDNDAAETYDLDLIEWDSDAATVSINVDMKSEEIINAQKKNMEAFAAASKAMVEGVNSFSKKTS